MGASVVRHRIDRYIDNFQMIQIKLTALCYLVAMVVGRTPIPPPGIYDRCSLPYDRGSCFPTQQGYYHDITDGRCKDFVYSNCDGDGNGNRFDTLRECQEACPASLRPDVYGTGNPNEKNAESICFLNPTSLNGFACYGAIPKWTFNSQKSVCEEYLYGGCGGTENLFNTQNECYSTCQQFHIVY